MANKSGHEVLYDKILVRLLGIGPLEHCKRNQDGSFVLNKDGDFVSNGGLVIPFTAVETESHQKTEGELIAMGELAYTEIKKKPKIGDTLTFPKYAGFVVIGNDGHIYRRLGCKEVGTIHKGGK